MLFLRGRVCSQRFSWMQELAHIPSLLLYHIACILLAWLRHLHRRHQRVLSGELPSLPIIMHGQVLCLWRVGAKRSLWLASHPGKVTCVSHPCLGPVWRLGGPEALGLMPVESHAVYVCRYIRTWSVCYVHMHVYVYVRGDIFCRCKFCMRRGKHSKGSIS
jgi:hypothetical protein